MSGETNNNKEKQFTDAYDAYADAIFRYCYYRVFDRDKAKDYVQETFCRTWKYIAEGNEIENIRAFLYKTANNFIIDESRKKKAVSLDQIMEKGFSPSVDFREKNENYLTGKEIVVMIHSLDKKYREVITMRYIDELSPREIASMTGDTEDNVSVKIHRGLQKVRKLLADQENHFIG